MSKIKRNNVAKINNYTSKRKQKKTRKWVMFPYKGISKHFKVITTPFLTLNRSAVMADVNCGIGLRYIKSNIEGCMHKNIWDIVA